MPHEALAVFQSRKPSHLFGPRRVFIAWGFKKYRGKKKRYFFHSTSIFNLFTFETKAVSKKSSNWFLYVFSGTCSKAQVFCGLFLWTYKQLKNTWQAVLKSFSTIWNVTKVSEVLGLGSIFWFVLLLLTNILLWL